jgi:hypothetical protein
VATGAVTVQFAAAGTSRRRSRSTSQNSTLDAVLQRVAAAPRRAGSKRRRPDRHALRDRPRRLLRRRRQLAGDDAIRVIDANSAAGSVLGEGHLASSDASGLGRGFSTPWAVEQINGQWITAGGVEFWKGLARQAVRHRGSPRTATQSWGVGELAGHQPAPGEQVGFFVTAGDQRAKDVRIVTARSNVVLLPFPTDGGAYYPFSRR